MHKSTTLAWHTSKGSPLDISVCGIDTVVKETSILQYSEETILSA